MPNILVNLISHAKYPSQFDGQVRKMKLALFMVPFMAAIAHHHLLLYLGCKPAVAININDLRFLCLLALSSSQKWLQLVFVDTVVKVLSQLRDIKEPLFWHLTMA